MAYNYMTRKAYSKAAENRLEAFVSKLPPISTGLR